ncbi:MAG: hypothetical protein LBT60_06830 [Oscillospiraceae bacterium]|jgi:hypothetical protein|nr:hypothetical protein [Oscillospiraceae bacterium]
MKTLVVFYSNTGRTQAHMIRLMEALGGERLITLRPRKSHTGPIGMLRAIRESIGRKPAKLEAVTQPPDMGAYDLVVLGTPVWAGRVSSPLRAFLQTYGQGIRRCAYVITHSGPEEYTAVLDELDGLTGVPRAAALSLGRFDKDAEARLAAFVQALSAAPS